MPFQAGADESLAVEGATAEAVLDVFLAAESTEVAVDESVAHELGIESSALATFASLGADETFASVLLGA
jgi:hypothetical protein